MVRILREIVHVKWGFIQSEESFSNILQRMCMFERWMRLKRILLIQMHAEIFRNLGYHCEFVLTMLYKSGKNLGYHCESVLGNRNESVFKTICTSPCSKLSARISILESLEYVNQARLRENQSCASIRICSKVSSLFS